MNEEELTKFKIECKIYKDKVDKLENVVDTQENRIVELEKRNDKTNFQYEQIMKTLNKLVEQTIPALSKEIQEIKEKPARRWETVIVGILGAIAGGIRYRYGKFNINELN